MPTLERLDTRALRAVITTFRDTVREHAGGLNRLNVYPVPDGDTGAAVLDGVILFGWRTGARVHVTFQTLRAPSATEPGCAGAAPGVNCFQGTIQIEPPSED